MFSKSFTDAVRHIWAIAISSNQPLIQILKLFKPMKTDKHLTVLLIEALKTQHYYGMCSCAMSLFIDDFITEKERFRLKEIMTAIRPRQIHTSGFYWHFKDYDTRIQKLSELQFNTNGKLLTYGK